MIKWKYSALVALIAWAITGCDDETVSVSGEQHGQNIPNHIKPDSNVTLAVAWDVDTEPYGVKIAPDNVGQIKTATLVEHDYDTLVGRTMSFNGSEALYFDYDSMLSIEDIQLSEQRAVSFWFKLDKEQESGQILSIMDGSKNTRRGREPFLMYDPDSGTLELWRKYHGSTEPNDAPPVNLIDDVPVERGKWHHIVVTSSLEYSQIFLNGELAGTGEPILVNSPALHFGRSYPGEVNPYPDVQSAKMAMDNIRVYQNEMSGRYVKALFSRESGEEAVGVPAINPTPSIGVKNIRFKNFELSWQLPPEFMSDEGRTFKVFVSDSEDFKNVISEHSTTDSFFKPELLEPGKTYYWRVDVVTNGEIAIGDVWRFTTEAEIDETQTPDQIRVMAYNIWWAGAAPGGARSQEYVYEQMVENGVDIVLMQESYGYQQALADKLGFHLWPKTDAEGQNITVLSRFPILDELINDGRFVGVRLDIGEGREIDVYSTWLHYGDDTVNSAADPEITNEELTEIDFAADYSVLEAALPEFEASAQSTRPIIVGGDHNTISHLDYTDASNRYGRGQLSLPKSELFQNEGYIDSYREVYPDETKDLCFTWSPFHTSNPGQGRIDFIHYKGDQITAVEAKCLLNDGHQEFHPSDHGAVITTFSVNKANW